MGIEGLSQPEKEVKAKIGAEVISLKSKEGEFELKGFLLAGNSIEHDFWDDLRVNIGQTTYDKKEVSLVASDFELVQNQKPQKNSRLATNTRFKIGDLKIRNFEEKGKFNAGNMVFEFNVSIAGGKETVFFETLRNLLGDEGSIDKYVFKYKPKIFLVNLESNNMDFADRSRTGSYKQLVIRTEGETYKENFRSNFETSVSNLQITEKQNSIRAGLASFKGNIDFSSKYYDDLVNILEQDKGFLDLEVIDAFYGFIKQFDLQTLLSISDLSFNGQGKQDSVTLSEGSIGFKIAFTDGIGSFSIVPAIKLSELKALRETLQMPIPINTLNQQLTASIMNINLQAFRELLTKFTNDDKQTKISLANKAIQDFVSSKPEAPHQIGRFYSRWSRNSDLNLLCLG